MTVMTMPETTVYEDCCVVTLQDEVGSPRQTTNMKAKTKPQSMQSAPDKEFGLRILATDTGHHPAADFRSNDIGHRAYPSGLGFVQAPAAALNKGGL
jgi:hypothetical protein